MKIAPIKTYSFYNTPSQTTKAFKTNSYTQDIFIKNQNISFAQNENKNRDEQVNALISYLINKNKNSNGKLSISDLQTAINKHVKNVKVAPFSKAPKELLYSNRLLGLYCVPIEFDETTNRAHLSDKNRFFYTNCASATADIHKLDICLNTVHEFTHILQDEDETINGLKIINDFLEQNSQNPEKITEQVGTVLQIRNIIEEEIRRPMVEFLLSKEGDNFREIFNDQPKILKALCNRVGIKDFKEYVQNIVSTVIDITEKERNIKLDKNLVYELTLNLFEKEKEAYKNQNLMLKKVTPATYRDFQTDARIQIYNESIKIIEDLKSNSN